MQRVIGGFFRLRRLFVSNVYLLDGGAGDRWLIDTGHWSERWQLESELRASGLRPSDLSGVLLTHRHSDHAGNAGYLRREYGVKIYAHRADAEVLSGYAMAPKMGDRGTLLERALCAVENRFPARVTVDEALEGGAQVAGLEVHSLPGHTDGSVFYRHKATGALLTGDTLLTAMPPLTLFRAVVPAYDAFSRDTQRAHESLRQFHREGWAYDHVLAGHGRPLVGRARDKVIRALDLR